MMGNIHKTDKLDAQGLATLLYLGKLPSVWIPPAEVRDERELPRTRMAFVQHRTRVMNRIRSTLAKYALSLDTASDIAFGIVFAFGGLAVGALSVGGVSVGVLALGGLSIGILTVGGLALVAFAFAGSAIAVWAANGGLAVANE